MLRPEDACQKRFSWFSDWNTKVQKCVNPKTHKCKSCRSRQELSNEYLGTIYLQHLASIQPRTSPQTFQISFPPKKFNFKSVSHRTLGECPPSARESARPLRPRSRRPRSWSSRSTAGPWSRACRSGRCTGHTLIRPRNAFLFFIL